MRLSNEALISPDEGLLIKGIEIVLENMEMKFTDLSRLKFNDVSQTLGEKLREQKIQERPFAYEFYHQLRILYDNGEIKEFIPNDIIPQAEVHKGYQAIPNLDRVPDFILHKPNTDTNFAVIEFKLASNLRKIEDDFRKLILFKRIGLDYSVKYEYLIEVVIGSKEELQKAVKHIERLHDLDGEEIIVIEFNTDSWKGNNFKIGYKDIQKCNQPQ